MLRSLARLAVVSLPCLAAACSSGGSGGGECTGNGNEALRTCAAGPVVHGVDVSYYQGTVNWAQVKASGRAFAFARVSDGLSVIDAQFAGLEDVRRVKAAESEGLEGVIIGKALYTGAVDLAEAMRVAHSEIED